MTLRATLGLIVPLIAGLTVGAHAQNGPTGLAETRLEYNRVADNLVLALSYAGGMIADPDPIPFIRVYGDGRVLVHYPAYMKNAGDYRLQLSPQELDVLLANFAVTELLTSPESLDAMAARVRAQSGPSELPGDHGVETIVEVNFDRVVPGDPARSALTDVETTISMRTADIAAAARTQIQPLQSFSNGVTKLEALAKRPDLVKLD